MSAVRLNRAQRRKILKLADWVDRVLQADRLYFERRPERQHLVKLSSRPEIEKREIIDGKPPTVPPSFRLLDLNEAVARRIFEWVVSSHTPEIQARLRKAAGTRP